MAVLAWFRFEGELNDFLPVHRRNIEFAQAAGVTGTLKHVIESLGVPHTEIERVQVNDEARPLSGALAQGDRVHVFPHAIPVALEDARFVVDGHLGRLAAYLRMLGLDTTYDRSADDKTLAGVASRERRFVLTRDIGLLKRREIERGYCVRSDRPLEQLRELSRRFALSSRCAPFSRCMECNGRLCAVAKEEITDLLPPHTRETKDQFSRCLNCGKIFWRGSHHDRMHGWIEDLKASA